MEAKQEYMAKRLAEEERKKLIKPVLPQPKRALVKR
jgi:hypothetical protein